MPSRMARIFMRLHSFYVCPEDLTMKISTIPQIYRNVNRWGEILSILSKYGLAGWISRFDLSFAKGLFKNRDGEALAKFSRERRIRLAAPRIIARLKPIHLGKRPLEAVTLDFLHALSENLPDKGRILASRSCKHGIPK